MGIGNAGLVALFNDARMEAIEKADLVEEARMILEATGADVPNDFKEHLEGLLILSKLRPLMEGWPASSRSREAERIAVQLSKIGKRIERLLDDGRNAFDFLSRTLPALPVTTLRRRTLLRDLRSGTTIDTLARSFEVFSRIEPLPQTVERAQFEFATDIWRHITHQEPMIATVNGDPVGDYLDFMRSALSFAGWSETSTKYENLRDRFYDYRRRVADKAVADHC